MESTKLSDEVRQIAVEALPLERIINRREVARNIRKAHRVERRIGRERIAEGVPRGRIQISVVKVSDTRGRAAC